MKGKRTLIRIGALGAITIMVLVAFAGSFSTACDEEPDDDDCVFGDHVILWAGQNIEVGVVNLWHNAEYLYVQYLLDDDSNDCGWYLHEVHLSVVVGSVDAIPQNKNNPKVGHFEFSMSFDTPVKETTFEIAWADIEDKDGNDFDWGDTLYIAAHAVVKKVCNGEVVQGQTAWGEGENPWKNWAMYFTYKPCEYKIPDFPEYVSYKMWHPWTNSYWKTELYVDDILYEIPEDWERDYFWGWCIDIENNTGSGAYLDATLSIPVLNPDDPDYDAELFCKWNKVNWILNNRDGFDWEEIQAAIWNIWLKIAIKTGSNAMGTGVNLDSTQATNAQYLVDNACCCFRPSENDWVAVILTPTTKNQICIIEWDP